MGYPEGITQHKGHHLTMLWWLPPLLAPFSLYQFGPFKKLWPIVEGNKVSLIFLIFAQGLIYDHSVNLLVLKIGVASGGCSGLSRGLKFFVVTPDMPCTGEN